MRRKIFKKKWILFGIALLLILFVMWVVWANTAPELNYITVKSADLPPEFSGFRIAHISDLHSADMVAELISLLKEADPDMIAFTGDLVDSYHEDTETTLLFLKKASEIAPCYYIRGNHEMAVENDTEYWKQVSDFGITVLNNEKTTLYKNNAEITVMGLDDLAFHSTVVGYAKDTLGSLMENEDGFTLLLSHRPESFLLYAENGVDLALTGHAHGGQIRLPFIGGLYAPNQGKFPKYDAGLYQKDGTQMVVSRGIGNSSFPLRFNNRPEVILVELVSE